MCEASKFKKLSSHAFRIQAHLKIKNIFNTNNTTISTTILASTKNKTYL